MDYEGTDYRCRCGVVIEVYGDLIIDGYSGKEISVSVDEGDVMTVIIPEDVTPYFVAPETVYGFDRAGRNVEVKKSTGEVTTLFSINQKIAAYQDALELGFPEVAAKLGISVSKLRSWKSVKPV